MKIVALVRFNSGLALVLDQPVELKYRLEKIDGNRYLVGEHGPFRSFLGYRRSRGRNDRAFAGRTLELTAHNGVTIRVKDHWWSCGDPTNQTTSVTFGTIPELQKCYVFSGARCEPEALQAMLDEYNNRTSEPYGWPDGGYIYPYWDFEKVINYNETTQRLRKEIRRLERAKRSLIIQARKNKRN